ncbi:histone deacetylase family protein [Dictyocaulus viviparus]|uniref:histone deacetylase n=1 Tax=Dictyocaulus viviparus TaxID=29172 RepID=A0A0D8XIS9_DICVI|nr:histone deacetylase family protein [Dictyocaulus viviparus]
MNGFGSLEYKTTLGFNECQKLPINTICKHHPQCPTRTEVCRSVLHQSGLLRDCQELNEFPSLDVSYLLQSHAEEYVNRVSKQSISIDRKSLNCFRNSHDYLLMTHDSVKAAQSAVSCCRFLTQSIMSHTIPNAFALVSSPGHHVSRHDASGSCIFNNAAQAADAAFDSGANRILIVDLDVHHGNGTQQIFYEDKRVMFFSIHRYENGKFWPHLEESNYDHIGDSEGRGYNVNIILNEVGCGDADYMTIFWNVLWPLAAQFNPDFVIVSAGFDSCCGDPIGGMCLSPDVYAHIIYHLSALACGKLLMILEGGYNHSVLSMGVQRCVRVLCGYKPQPVKIYETPKISTIESCLNCISILRGLWSCFDFYNNVGPWVDAPWSLHHSINNAFVASEEGVVQCTNSICQGNLPQFNWKCRALTSPKLTRTILVHNCGAGNHYSCSDYGHPEKPERITKISRGRAKGNVKHF